MKKFLLVVILFIGIVSCEKNKAQCEQLEMDFQTALFNTGGNPAALAEIIRQYNERRNELDCD